MGCFVSEAGQLWAIMGNYGQLWAIMGNYGQLWAIMGNYGLLRQRSRAIMGKARPAIALQSNAIKGQCTTSNSKAVFIINFIGRSQQDYRIF